MVWGFHVVLCRGIKQISQDKSVDPVTGAFLLLVAMPGAPSSSVLAQEPLVASWKARGP